MSDSNPVRIYIPKDLEVAELIEWGYECGGDFDESLRVYSEKAQLDGFTLEYTETELVRAREDFDREFGKDRHERAGG